MPGTPDICGILGDGSGRWLGIEVKAGRDQMREAQLAFRDMILSANGVYLVARGVEDTLADLRDKIRPRQ
jgi:hypothetical protein